jgi:hypothetical protein
MFLIKIAGRAEMAANRQLSRSLDHPAEARPENPASVALFCRDLGQHCCPNHRPCQIFF